MKFGTHQVLITVKAKDVCTMQTSGEGLFTFLPQSFPFLYQPTGGLTGTVVIQSSVPTAAAPVQLVQQQRFVLSMVITVA